MSLFHEQHFPDPVLCAHLTDTLNGQIHVLLYILNDPEAPRFNVDVMPDGSPTRFGTLKRNLEAEQAAKEAGLAPGQVRRGLRLLHQAMEAFEGFVVSLGHDMYFVEPLYYHNAVIFERYGFAYQMGKRLMDSIQAGFQEGGDLHPLLNDSNPFRSSNAVNSIRLRSWAPKVTLDVIEQLDWVKKVDSTAEELNYLLQQSPDSPLGQREEVIVQLAEALRNAIRADKTGNKVGIAISQVASALQLTDDAGLPRTTVFIGCDGLRRFHPVEAARKEIETLLRLFARGLREPLRFFQETSYEYARRDQRPSERERTEARVAALRKWRGDDSAMSGRNATTRTSRCASAISRTRSMRRGASRRSPEAVS